MTIYYARQPLPAVILGPSIFLVGPTYRDDTPSWRNDAIAFLESIGYTGTVFVPEDVPGPNGVIGGIWAPGMGDYRDQTRWEWKAIGLANTVVAWVPRELKARDFIPTKPGFRGFIQACLADWAMRWGIPLLGALPGLTTNVEFGALLAPITVSKVLLGAPPEADKMGYLRQLGEEYDLFSRSMYKCPGTVAQIPYFDTLEGILTAAAQRA